MITITPGRAHHIILTTSIPRQGTHEVKDLPVSEVVVVSLQPVLHVREGLQHEGSSGGESSVAHKPSVVHGQLIPTALTVHLITRHIC